MHARLVEYLTSVSVSSKMQEFKSKTDKRSETNQPSEVHMLKKQVQDSQQQLAVLSVSHSQPVQHVQPQAKSTPFTGWRPSKNKDDYFCYHCGEDGHIATKCQFPENSAQVIQKLVHSI